MEQVEPEALERLQAAHQEYENAEKRLNTLVAITLEAMGLDPETHKINLRTGEITNREEDTPDS